MATRLQVPVLTGKRPMIVKFRPDAVNVRLLRPPSASSSNGSVRVRYTLSTILLAQMFACCMHYQEGTELRYDILSILERLGCIFKLGTLASPTRHTMAWHSKGFLVIRLLSFIHAICCLGLLCHVQLVTQPLQRLQASWM